LRLQAALLLSEALSNNAALCATVDDDLLCRLVGAIEAHGMQPELLLPMIQCVKASGQTLRVQQNRVVAALFDPRHRRLGEFLASNMLSIVTRHFGGREKTRPASLPDAAPRFDASLSMDSAPLRLDASLRPDKPAVPLSTPSTFLSLSPFLFPVPSPLPTPSPLPELATRVPLFRREMRLSDAGSATEHWQFALNLIELLAAVAEGKSRHAEQAVRLAVSEEAVVSAAVCVDGTRHPRVKVCACACVPL
jgi:hypothetical protein